MSENHKANKKHSNHKQNENKETDYDEIAIDFSRIKNWFTKKKEKSKQKSQNKLDAEQIEPINSDEHTPQENKKEKTDEKEEIAIDMDAAKKFLKKYSIILLILIPIFFSIFFRMYPAYLPITDDWATSTVENHYQSQIMQKINAQYPNLPDLNKQQLIDSEWARFYSENKDMLKDQIKGTSLDMKKHYQDDTGQTYLLAIDPWLAYGYAKNKINYGHWGNELDEEGQSMYTLRNGREGQEAGFRLLPYLMTVNYKIMNIFTDASVLSAAFYIPVILLTLASIATFFIAKQFTGNIGAIVASTVFGIHAALLNRTAAGFSDTDNIIAFFEMIVVLFFILALNEKQTWKRIAYILLSGVSTGLYIRGHPSWWHIFDFLLGALFVYLIYQILKERKKIAEKFSNIFRSVEIKNSFVLGIIFFVSSLLFGTLIRTITDGNFIYWLKRISLMPFTEPLKFMLLKEVGINSIWPNVLTTVAELNTFSVSGVIVQIGGKLLFALSLLGIALLILKKTKNKNNRCIFYATLLIFWYIGSIYAAQSSVRFIAFVVPAFALSIGAFAYFFYEYGSEIIQKGMGLSKNTIRPILAILLMVLIIVPLIQASHQTSKNEIPTMNDAWYGALTKIKDNSNDAIISSWWDFGHWFVAVSERRVTFDGGDQGRRIHWIGKTLVTDNEDEAIGILRMLNCVQEKAPDKLDEFTGKTSKSIEILYDIFPISNPALAKEKYMEQGLNDEQATEMLDYTHCTDLIDQFVITSEDMVGKAGVWAHFGSWNFEKAEMFNKVKGKTYTQGVSILEKEFDLSETESDRLFYEIQEANGDQWISPWPNYMSGVRNCGPMNNGTLDCLQSLQGNNIVVRINLKEKEAKLLTNNNQKIVPNSLVYVTKQETVEKEMNDGSQAGFSVVLIPTGKDTYASLLAHPLIANSMFTRLFFLNGHGLKHFNLFDDRTDMTGLSIKTWTVDWEEGESNEVYSSLFEEKEDEDKEKLNEEIENTEQINSDEPILSAELNEDEKEKIDDKVEEVNLEKTIEKEIELDLNKSEE